jgi:hypothetical protein
MTEYLFRKVFFPKALERQADGTYVIQNRQYKPVGFAVKSNVHVIYADHPVRVKMRLTKVQARLLSFNGSEDVNSVHLYDDTCVPERSKSNWDAYCQRLARLARIKVTLL